MNISVICHNPKCGTKFQARRKSAKYCSTKCRDSVARLRKGGAAKERGKCANCKYCGRSFYVASKGRFPSFCSDSHRVMYHNNVRTAAVHFLTHTRPGEFKCMKRDSAMDFIENMSNEQIIALWVTWGYRFDSRQFVKMDEQPLLI